MLFGSKELQEKIIAEVHNVERDKKIKVVFGATVGSISKGFQYYDSDYDSRFLFVKKDFPEKIYYSPHAQESEVVYRYLPEKKLIDELLPFWELTSFLQYLVIPGLDNKFSLGIYNIISWTFLSPYTWDPYGIQNRIIPLINSIFVREYKIGYHINEIESKLKELESPNVIAKNYLDLIYSALIIEYCINYNLQPPTHYSSLAALSKYPAMYEKVTGIVQTARNNAYEYIIKNNDAGRSTSHFVVRVSQDEYVTKYIYMMHEQGKTIMKDNDFLSDHRKNEMQDKINNMYNIVNDAMQKILLKDFL